LVRQQQQGSPGVAGTLLLTGLLALAEGDGSAAQGALEQALTLAPGAPDICLPLSYLYAQSGAAQRAEAVLYQALQHDPACGPAYLRLARLAITRKAWPLAEEAAAQACVHSPQDAAAWNTHGVALRHLGRSAEAEEAFRRCLSLDPDTAPALGNLAQIALEHQNGAEVVALTERILALNPQSSHALLMRADGLRLSRRFEDAEQAYLGLLQATGPSPAPLNGLALTVMSLGRYEQALDTLDQALALNPDDADQWANGAMTAAQGALWSRVATYAERALALAPGHGVALTAQGWAHLALGQTLAARDCFAAVLEGDPNNAGAVANLASVLRRAVLLGDCLDLCLAALERGVSSPDIFNNAGVALLELRRVIEAEQMFLAALDPPGSYNPEALSNLCLALLYDQDCGLEERTEVLRAYGRQVAPAVVPDDHPNRRDPGRRLRVGFVSGDLRRHSVAYFLAPVLEAWNRDEAEIWLYSCHPEHDEMTDRLRVCAAGWRDVSALPDPALVAQIRADQIDVLVDLAGHSSHNRLPVFAQRPAPVQLTWLGFPAVTGVMAFDGRLVDDVSDPSVGNAEPPLEPLIRLPRCFLAYQPPPEAPPPAALPVGQGQPFTFGSFNTAHKINSQVLDSWAEILHQAPHSRLFLKAKQYADTATRDGLYNAFALRGIDAARVEAIGFTKTLADHLALYGRVDLALDSFPYNGTTTTCEALWMGVPTLTLRGESHLARVGASLLTAAGLGDLLVAEDRADYCRRAVALAANPQPLADLRPRIRDHLATTSLADVPGLSAALADEMRRLWQRWCAG
jgi:predicted O-linked N-acetylglucosamine transferase (SPINDLY family)